MVNRQFFHWSLKTCVNREDIWEKILRNSENYFPLVKSISKYLCENYYIIPCRKLLNFNVKSSISVSTPRTLKEIRKVLANVCVKLTNISPVFRAPELFIRLLLIPRNIKPQRHQQKSQVRPHARKSSINKRPTDAKVALKKDDKKNIKRDEASKVC